MIPTAEITAEEDHWPYGTLGRRRWACDGRIEGFAHCDDSPNDRRAIGLFAELADEALIDLDLVEREAAQVAERRVAGSEIVHRNADAQFLGLTELEHCGVQVMNHDGLGDLELQPAVIEPGFLQRLRDGLD